ncbi:MAG: hypothetical protein H2041_16370 [Phenylobacterium sp.]|uniref:hypothetical protein n=1 Tax=Phenylobacterium sp. TaxID=1871053 RepID=UPI00180BB057|nr:hypothetical protein [Phenylobacterium sp.]MBA4795235.1 hypothetical protein [Phenylobacterium sp.]
MTGNDKPKPTPEAEREAKLAQALRANLRRRKAPAKSEGPRGDAPSETGDDKRS